MTRGFETTIKFDRLKHEMYKVYWRFIRKLNCVELSTLSAYKENSIDINTLLRVTMLLSSHDADRREASTSMDILRERVAAQLLDIDCPISSSHRNAVRFIEKTQAQIATLTSLYSKSPRTVDKELVVYRGTTIGESSGYYVEKFKKGSIFGTAAFFSTSLDIKIALEFAKVYGTLFRVILPKNTPYLLLPGGPGTDYGKSTRLKDILAQTTWDQVEVVLDRRTLYKVMKIENLEYYDQKELRSLRMYTIKYVGQSSSDKNTMIGEASISATDIVNSISNVSISVASPPL